ncbi:MAG: methionyl-tRNA formyltransferase [Actinomycetota bacterium]
MVAAFGDVEVSPEFDLAPLPTSPVRRVAFLGTPDIAAGALACLIENRFDVALVVTRADKRRGRGSTLMGSPVKHLAEEHGIPVVHDLESLLDEHHVNPIDIGVVVAYGALIKPHVLAEIPMVNLHVSLLPRWRGAAPIERAILAGDDTTGVCLMQLEVGLDTGGVIASATMPIGDSTTAQDIRTQLLAEGNKLLLHALRTGDFRAQPQSGTPTYAAKIEPAERHIDWSEPATLVSRRVRIGGAWSTFRDRRFKIHSVTVRDIALPKGRVVLDGDRIVVGCGEGSVELREVQPEGKPRVPAQDWARGARLQNGDSFDHV